MRIVVLGGAGEMGQIAVRTAAELPFVGEIVVADRNFTGAEVVAAQSRNARAVPVDLRDRDGLAAVIAGVDVVINASGPFFELGVPVLEAVIEAGANYLDICDDWEPTLDMLALDGRARERGVTAVLGIGASPGLTNLLAVKAASALDVTHELLTGWCIDDLSGEETAKMAQRTEPSAATIHWMQQLSGKIRVQKDGEPKLVKPLQRREIAFPGLGRIAAWTVGHPEAVTLPRTVVGLRSCVNVMTCSDEKTFWGLKLLQGLVDTGVFSIREAARELERSDEKGGAAKSKPFKNLPGLFGWAEGLKDGRPVVSAAWLRGLPAGGMGGTTGVPLGLALHLFAGETRPRSGVLTPEEAIAPDWFFNLLAPWCVGDFATGADLIEHGQVTAEAAR